MKVTGMASKWLSDYFADTRNLSHPALHALGELALTADAEIDSYRDLWAQRSDDADHAEKQLRKLETALVALRDLGWLADIVRVQPDQTEGGQAALLIQNVLAKRHRFRNGSARSTFTDAS